MGNTFKTGNYVNAIFQDSSNNIGIGGAANASYKLQVTGTTNLTGALSGTSATFSGALTVTNNVTIRPTAGYNAYFQTSGTALRINYLNDALSTNISASYRATDYSFQDGSGAAILTLASTGNVGIGVIVPVGALHIKSAANTQYGVYDAPTAGYCYQEYKYNGTTYGYVGQGASITGGGNNTDMAIVSLNNMVFGAGGTTERMRITSGGYVTQKSNGGSYFSGPYSQFSNFNNVSGDINMVYGLGSNTQNASSYFLICATYGVGDKMYVLGNGNLQNLYGTYGTMSSDFRLKENITEATSKLNDLMALRVVNFNLKDDTDKKKQIGFIAQEFKEVFPSLVYEKDTREYDEDGNVTKGLEDALGLNVGMEFAILVKAIQELSAKVTALESGMLQK